MQSCKMIAVFSQCVGAINAAGNTSDSWNVWAAILEEVRLELNCQIEEKMKIHMPIVGEIVRRSERTIWMV